MKLNNRIDNMDENRSEDKEEIQKYERDDKEEMM